MIDRVDPINLQIDHLSAIYKYPPSPATLNTMTNDKLLASTEGHLLFRGERFLSNLYIPHSAPFLVGSLNLSPPITIFTFHFSLSTFYFSLFTFYFLLFTFHFLLSTFHFLLFTFHFQPQPPN
jgi:hypothetical protein